MQQITVYTKPGCSQCDQVVKFLNKRELPYILEPIDDNVLEVARFLKFRSAPIVKYDTGSTVSLHCGFNELELWYIFDDMHTY